MASSVKTVPSLGVHALLKLTDAQNLGVDDSLHLEAEVKKMVVKNINNHYKSVYSAREGAAQFAEWICKSWFLFVYEGLLGLKRSLTIQLDLQNVTYKIEKRKNGIRVICYCEKGLMKFIWTSDGTETSMRPDIIEYARFLFPPKE